MHRTHTLQPTYQQQVAEIVRNALKGNYQPDSISRALRKGRIFQMQNKWGRFFWPGVGAIALASLVIAIITESAPMFLIVGFALGALFLLYLFVKYVL
jgi:hypothetical protein